MILDAGATSAHVLSPPRYGDNPSWSPDGQVLAFDLSAEYGHGEITTISPDGSNVRDLSRLGRHPSWSPDGSQLVFERSGNLWLVNADGSNLRLLLKDGHTPDWSH